MSLVKTRRMGPREPARDRLARRAGQQDAAAVHREIPLAWKARRRALGRRGEERRPEIVAAGNRVQLQVVSVLTRPASPLDGARPPREARVVAGSEPNDPVPSDGVSVEHASDEREVMEIERARIEAGVDRDERAPDVRPDRQIAPGEEAARRPEVEDDVWIPRQRDVHRAREGIHRETGRVRHRKRRHVRPSAPRTEREDQVFVLPRNEKRDPGGREHVPERSTHAVTERLPVRLAGGGEPDHLGRQPPRGVPRRTRGPAAHFGRPAHMR
jgi:hypothetical protein